MSKNPSHIIKQLKIYGIKQVCDVRMTRKYNFGPEKMLLSINGIIIYNNCCRMYHIFFSVFFLVSFFLRTKTKIAKTGFEFLFFMSAILINTYNETREFFLLYDSWEFSFSDFRGKFIVKYKNWRYTDFKCYFGQE